VDGRRRSVGSTGQGQFAAFDPEPVEDDDEPADGEDEGDDGDEDEDDDSVDPPEDLPGDEVPADPLLEALSLALAAFRLSVR
jgi:hypothetical protein